LNSKQLFEKVVTELINFARQILQGKFCKANFARQILQSKSSSTVKLGNKERFDKELIDIKELFPVTNLPFTSLE